MEALYYSQEDSGHIRCELCPHACLLKPDQTGISQLVPQFLGETDILGGVGVDDQGFIVLQVGSPADQLQFIHKSVAVGL